MTRVGVLPVALSAFQQRLVLSACPRGASLLTAHPVREGPRICPLWVDVALPGGAPHRLLLRIDRSEHGVALEARLLPILARAGLPVAEVLAGPGVDPDAPALGAQAVYSVLPGHNMLHLIYQASAEGKRALSGLLLDAIDAMQAATEPVRQRLIDAGLGGLLPTRGLAYEFEAAAASDAVDQDPALGDAAVLLAPLVRAVRTPLVFWNGDFNPANFLSDGERITGYVDFAHAAWHDPHYGLARYTIYPWIHLDRPALFAEYCRRHHLAERDFALRSAVHCLWMLAGQSDHILDEAAAAPIRTQLSQDLRTLTA